MKTIQVLFDKHSAKFVGSPIGFYDRLYICDLVAGKYGVQSLSSIVYDSANLLMLEFECDDTLFPDDALDLYCKAGAFMARIVS